MWFNNLSVSKKIALCFAGVVCVVVAMSVSTFVTLNKARAVGVQNDYSREELSNSADTLSALVEEQNAVRGLVASGDESFADKIKTAGDQVAASLQTMTATNTDPDDAANIAALKQAITEVHTQEQAQIAGASDPAKRVATQATIAASGRLTQVRTLLKAITDPESAKLARRAPIEDADFAMARDVLIGGGVLSMLLSAALGWMLSRAIARPVADMTGAMTKLAAGDNTVEVPAAGRKDEIGAMAEAVQTFKTAAIEKIALEAKAADQRRGAEDTRRASEAERAAAAEEQAGVVGAIATGLEKLSGGVLTFRIGQAFAPAYEKLRTDFNAAMQQLQDTMKVVADNAGGIRSGAGEISQASDDLSRRTEQQAASLEETAAALDQITATVRKTAEGSNQARETVSVAKSDAETSGGVVREAISAMGEIEDSARQISQIISVIDEIAFQTNLLALNAGVEAARAGDAGKGFAVVASEVRALAQRSAEAAKEIKALISASSQQVDRGVNLVGQTGKALERIVVQVGEINGVVAEIAASAQEQAAGLAQVNTAVNQMDQVTQQNAAMVEQSTAASHALAHEAEELARLIARFDLGQTSNVESIRKPSPRHEAPVTALKTIGGRGAPATVRRPDPQDEQGWAESFEPGLDHDPGQ